MYRVNWNVASHTIFCQHCCNKLSIAQLCSHKLLVLRKHLASVGECQLQHLCCMDKVNNSPFVHVFHVRRHFAVQLLTKTRLRICAIGRKAKSLVPLMWYATIRKLCQTGACSFHKILFFNRNHQNSSRFLQPYVGFYNSIINKEF